METHKKLIKPTPLLLIKPNPGNLEKPDQSTPPLLIKPRPGNPEKPDQTHTSIPDQEIPSPTKTQNNPIKPT